MRRLLARRAQLPSRVLKIAQIGVQDGAATSLHSYAGWREQNTCRLLQRTKSTCQVRVRFVKAIRVVDNEKRGAFAVGNGIEHELLDVSGSESAGGSNGEHDAHVLRETVVAIAVRRLDGCHWK